MHALRIRSLATRAFGAVLHLGIAGCGLAAQEPPARPLRAAPALVVDLASGEPDVVAWAAYDARRLGNQVLIAPLRKALRAQRDDQDALVAFARLFVLDALAGLAAKVPAAELQPWLDDARAGPAAFLLLARQPRIHETELFAAFRAGWPLAAIDRLPAGAAQQSTLRTQALGNVLGAQKTPGFAALLLAHADLDLHATITTPGRQVRTSGPSARVLFGTADPLPAGWPPLPVYTFLRTDRPGKTDCEWVAPGPIEVGIARRQLAKEPPVARSPVVLDAFPDLAAALPWLQALAGARPVPPTTVTIPFAGADACARELVAARDALREFRRRLLQDLVAAQALGEADAARLGAIEVQVHVDDQRVDQAVPLPDLPKAK